MSNAKFSDLNDNLDAFELTETELNSVVGGGSMQQQMQQMQMQQRMQQQMQRMQQMQQQMQRMQGR
jgi:bacteriocin-like protein